MRKSFEGTLRMSKINRPGVLSGIGLVSMPENNSCYTHERIAADDRRNCNTGIQSEGSHDSSISSSCCTRIYECALMSWLISCSWRENEDDKKDVFRDEAKQKSAYSDLYAALKSNALPSNRD